MKENEKALEVIYKGGAAISDDTLDEAVEWIEHHSYQDLRTLMQTEAWQFNYEPEYNSMPGLDLRELAIEQMYEDPIAVAETIDKAMNIVIKVE